MSAPRLKIRGLSAGVRAETHLHDLTLDLPAGGITAVIGPAGCGKSTLLRCLDRLHEARVGAWVKGTVLLDDDDLYAADRDPVQVRREVGLVPPQPTLLGRRSVGDNVLLGPRLTGGRADFAHLEAVLREVGLWAELRERLDAKARTLTPGQRRRLAIARAVAMSPRVLAFDEPSVGIGPMEGARIEDLIGGQRGRRTVIVATGDARLAARIADHTIFLLDGHLVEAGASEELFTDPKDERTEDFITGRFH